MRILNAYITRGFLMTFGISLLVFLFVMAIGNIFKVIDLFSRGVSGILILQVFSYGIPFSLIFAIPMSVLAAVFLQFNRLASDREIIAMRACGISLWEIVRPPFLISLALCVLCIYINCNVAPDSHYARRNVLSKLGVETPISLLDEGRFIRDFPGLTIYIGKKSDSLLKNTILLKDIVVYQVEKDGPKRTIRAASGTVAPATNEPGKININLFRVRIEQPDEQHPENLTLTRYLNADEYPLTIDVQQMINREVVWKKRADLKMSEIISTLRLSARFVPRDFIDPDRMIAALNDDDNAFGSYVKSLLFAPARAALNAYDGSRAQQKRITRILAAEFNRIITAKSIYTPDRFAHVKLSERTMDFIRNNQQDASAIRLNRMLLEDAFPGQLARSAFLDLYQGDSPVMRTALLVEANTRIALSCSCFAFVLMGAVLGIKIHRKESFAGIAIALALVFVFFLFIIIADALVNYPETQPHLIVWTPFILSQVLGFFLIQRAN